MDKKFGDRKITDVFGPLFKKAKDTLFPGSKFRLEMEQRNKERLDYMQNEMRKAPRYSSTTTTNGGGGGGGIAGPTGASGKTFRQVLVEEKLKLRKLKYEADNSDYR